MAVDVSPEVRPAVEIDGRPAVMKDWGWAFPAGTWAENLGLGGNHRSQGKAEDEEGFHG